MTNKRPVMTKFRKLVADLRGDVIEAHARASGCSRSAANMRACLYAGGAGCECRKHMEARWPEHMKDAIINGDTPQ